MDIIITNKHKDVLSSLNPNNINVLNGFYDVETLTEMVKGFSYDKIILDITSLKDYDDKDVLKKLTSLNPNDIVLFLDEDDKCSSKEFLSKLVNLGIYNFTKNIAGVKHLLNNPNSYDVVKSLAEYKSEFSEKSEEIKDTNADIKKEDSNETKESLLKESLENQMDENTDNFPTDKDLNKTVFFNGPVDPTKVTENITSALKGIEEDLPIEEKNDHDLPFEEPVFEEKIESEESVVNEEPVEETIEEPNMYSEEIEYGDYALSNDKRRVIGVKNITDHAGATTLIYLMYKDIIKRKTCLAIEVDTLDLNTYRERDFVSSTKYEIKRDILKYSAADIILVDLNTFDDYTICDQIIYLIEPSLIKMTKLRLKDKEIFNKLKKGKIVLNKSMLSDTDITDFEYETKSEVFFNIPPINDREEDNREIVNLLSKLGI